MQHLVIIGGGFAGVWAALAATDARRRAGRKDIAITLVSQDAWLTIRPRLYESSLNGTRVPLDEVLGPGVERVEGTVTRIDASTRTISVTMAGGPRALAYDRLILAAGSRLVRAPIPGMEHAFSVDTFAEANALERHLTEQAATEASPTTVVVGAGFTGIEVATGLASRQRRVVLVEAAKAVAPDLTADARRHVLRALTELGIEWHTGDAVAAIGTGGVTLDSGTFIAAATTVWTGGFRANDLAAQFPVKRDALGRLPVDALLRVRGVDGVYAAGDVAAAMADAQHVAPMSCQHAIPMGERAGANAMADLVGTPAVPYAEPDYVTCLDLGAAGAIFMQGWPEQREVKLTGRWAKQMKQMINRQLIYPPRAREARRAA